MWSVLLGGIGLVSLYVSPINHLTLNLRVGVCYHHGVGLENNSKRLAARLAVLIDQLPLLIYGEDLVPANKKILDEIIGVVIGIRLLVYLVDDAHKEIGV